MSTNRVRRDYGFHGKGPNGRNVCRQCGTEVPVGRRTFCGDVCVDRWRIKTDPGFVREKVFARDRGICAICGVDTESLRLTKAWKKCIRLHDFTRYDADSTEATTGHIIRSENARRRDESERRYRVIKEKERKNLESMGFPYACSHGGRTLWDADHIIPVIEGGGECDLDNYRTLCVPCHKQVTAELAARRAARRRAEQTQEPSTAHQPCQLSLIEGVA